MCVGSVCVTHSEDMCISKCVWLCLQHMQTSVWTQQGVGMHIPSCLCFVHARVCTQDVCGGHMQGASVQR